MNLHEANTRLCCPLSFCGSLEHITVQDCDHPQKFAVIEPTHTRLLRNIQERVEERVDRVVQMDTRPIMTTLLDEVKYAYFNTSSPINEEQLDILMFRLKVPTARYWNVSYEERIEIVLSAYRKIIRRFMAPTVVEPNVFMTMDGSGNILLNNGGGEPTEEDLLELDHVFENEPFLIPDDEEVFEMLVPLNSCCGLEAVHISNKGEQTAEMKQTDCPICYETGCHIMTQCNHLFCTCLITYIEKKGHIMETTGCPCCRQTITSLGIYDITACK